MNRIFSRRASASIEYATLVLFILAALLFFQNYIIRGLAGKWKASSDTFGFGRQYDPRLFGKAGDGGGTLECYFDGRVELWLDRKQVELTCGLCNLPPEDPVYQQNCRTCLKNAANPYCQK